MRTLFIEGGFPMWAVLAFGLISLVTAFVFAVRPSERNIRFIRNVAAATLFASLSGFCIDVSTTIHYVMESGKVEAAQRAFIICEGVGESLAPVIMGFTMLALVALFLAVGMRRLDARKA